MLIYEIILETISIVILKTQNQAKTFVSCYIVSIWNKSFYNVSFLNKNN